MSEIRHDLKPRTPGLEPTKKEKIKILNDMHLDYIDEYINSSSSKKVHPSIKEGIKNRKCVNATYICHTVQTFRKEELRACTSVYIEDKLILVFDFTLTYEGCDSDGGYNISSLINVLDPEDLAYI